MPEGVCFCLDSQFLDGGFAAVLFERGDVLSDGALVEAEPVLDVKPFRACLVQLIENRIEPNLPLPGMRVDDAKDSCVEGRVFEEDGSTCTKDVFFVGDKGVASVGVVLHSQQLVEINHCLPQNH